MSRSMVPHGRQRQLVSHNDGALRHHDDQMHRMMARADQFHKEMDQMAGNMFKHSMFGSDPFANDPFFNSGSRGGLSRSPFGDMDAMIKQMKDEMHRGPQLGGAGRFNQQTVVSSTKMDQHGRPIKETYATKAHGGVAPGGKKIVQREQMYENSGTGLQKMGHERMVDNYGRKVVRERIGGQGGPTNSFDHYRNIRQEDVHDFDREWERLASQMNMPSSQARIGFGDQGAYQNGGGGSNFRPQQERLGFNHREQNQSRLNQQQARRDNGIAPTIPAQLRRDGNVSNQASEVRALPGPAGARAQPMQARGGGATQSNQPTATRVNYGGAGGAGRAVARGGPGNAKPARAG